MPTYANQPDSPPIPARVVSSAHTVSSTYSDGTEIPKNHPDDVPSLKVKPSYHPSYHAHPKQNINDYGPQVRQSRLPLFNQVRTMLHKPLPPLTTPGSPKWDEYTGELSDSGKESRVKPSTYTSPYQGAFQVNRRRSPDRLSKSRRSLSPVSILRDEEIYSSEPVNATKRASPNDWSPVSPVSISPIEYHVPNEDKHMIPKPLSPNVERAPPPVPDKQTPRSQIKRKPAPRSISAVENQTPLPSPAQQSPTQMAEMAEPVSENKKDVEEEEEEKEEWEEWEETGDGDAKQSSSHFSWTTYAPSVAPARQSTDTRQTKQVRGSYDQQQQPDSRFSWSTVNTNTTHHPARPDSPPPSPPPPIPTKYADAPMQSILSRRRPIQRIEKEEWTPPARISSAVKPITTVPKDSSTPTSATTARPLPLPKDPRAHRTGARSPSTPISATGGTPTSTSSKALPPPPALTADTTLTHLETLQTRERDLILQRRNVEKGISELEKIEKASPLEVPFATVRDAKKRLEVLRKRLAEVMLEEREVGIAVSRSRNKEEKEGGGEGAGLWVRRVTS